MMKGDEINPTLEQQCREFNLKAELARKEAINQQLRGLRVKFHPSVAYTIEPKEINAKMDSVIKKHGLAPLDDK